MLISVFAKNRLSFGKNRFFFDYRISMSTLHAVDGSGRGQLWEVLCATTSASHVGGGLLCRSLSPLLQLLSTCVKCGELPCMSKCPPPTAEAASKLSGVMEKICRRWRGRETTHISIDRWRVLQDVSSVCLPSLNERLFNATGLM